jgi:hypothetical protein
MLYTFGSILPLHFWEMDECFSVQKIFAKIIKEVICFYFEYNRKGPGNLFLRMYKYSSNIMRNLYLCKLTRGK